MDKMNDTSMFIRVGYAFVPIQQMNELYSPQDGLKAGTIFPELNIPPSEYSPSAN